MEEAVQQLTQVLTNIQTLQSTKTNTADLKGIQLQMHDEENESFEMYLQRLENYLELRNLDDKTIENDKKCVQILINCLGPKYYQILASLTAPELPKVKKFQELITLLRDHLCPKPSEVSEQTVLQAGCNMKVSALLIFKLN